MNVQVQRKNKFAARYIGEEKYTSQSRRTVGISTLVQLPACYSPYMMHSNVDATIHAILMYELTYD